jgi:diguanylate cyclase (GGDEF)-like protein/PAS domain S-box-containing protein
MFDARQRLWVGTFGGGLALYDPQADRFVRIGDQDQQSYYITELAESEDGSLWVGTYWNGLQRVDPESRSMSVASEIDISRPINGLLPTESGDLWVATRGAGVYRLKADGVVEHRTQRNGLTSDFVQALRLDPEGALWASTDNGLARLDPGQMQFDRVALFAGSTTGGFNHGAFDIDADGHFWLGSEDGLFNFDPLQEDPPAATPRVVVTEVRSRFARYPMRLNPEATRQTLLLSHDETALNFGFAAQQYLDSNLIQYSYYLEGQDESWWFSDARQRDATYTNLPSGEYTFAVRARNPGGAWSETYRLPLEVGLPPWRSNLAYTGYLLVFAALLAIGGYVVHSRRRLESSHRVALQKREKRLELALWGSGDWLWDWDIKGKRIFCPQFAAYAGIDADQGWMRIEDYNQSIDPADLEMIIEDTRARIFDVDDLEYEFRVTDAAGDSAWMQIRGKVVERCDANRPVRVTGTTKNVTAKKSAERGLITAARILENSHDAVAILDLDHHFIQVNRAFERITGYSEEEVIGRHSRLLNSGRHSAEFMARLLQTLELKGEWHGELWERRKSGEAYCARITLSMVEDDVGRRAQYVAIFSDITRRLESERELRFLANYDALTELPNRTLFVERLSHAIVKARRSISRVAIMFIDIDDFKQINDSLGKVSGDLVLKTIADRLSSAMREEDTIARLGADEYAILIEGTESDREVEDLTRVLFNSFKSPIQVSGQNLRVQASIGISVYPNDGNESDDLIQNAQTAVSVAKEKKQGEAVFYAGEMRSSALDQLRMEEQLAGAIGRGELELHYQPKIETHSGRLCGVEALLRWRREPERLISPAEFIPLAEKRGLILEIGEWVLRRACQEIMSLTEHGLEPVPLAVNLSPRQTEDETLADVVETICRETGYDASMLQLEITETMIMAHAGETARVLERLREQSIKLVVDDFGTGYSSLSYLNRLPIDHIKIDKTFVDNVETDRYSRAIVSAVLSMADSLGLKVTAEGVERPEQFQYLREVGCKEIQGFLISRPLDFEQLVEFIRAPHTLPVTKEPSIVY